MPIFQFLPIFQFSFNFQFKSTDIRESTLMNGIRRGSVKSILASVWCFKFHHYSKELIKYWIIACRLKSECQLRLKNFRLTVRGVYHLTWISSKPFKFWWWTILYWSKMLLKSRENNWKQSFLAICSKFTG